MTRARRDSLRATGPLLPDGWRRRSLNWYRRSAGFKGVSARRDMVWNATTRKRDLCSAHAARQRIIRDGDELVGPCYETDGEPPVRAGGRSMVSIAGAGRTRKGHVQLCVGVVARQWCVACDRARDACGSGRCRRKGHVKSIQTYVSFDEGNGWEVEPTQASRYDYTGAQRVGVTSRPVQTRAATG